jgi:hypothetical protein
VRAGPDGTLSTWLDGKLIIPDKLAAWLKDDILLRRVKVPNKRRGHGHGNGHGNGDGHGGTEPLLRADE